MDLAVGAKHVWVMTTHTTKDGEPKLVECCSYPLTAAATVECIYTDLATIDVTGDGFVVRDMIEGISRDELQALTNARLVFR